MCAVALEVKPTIKKNSPLALLIINYKSLLKYNDLFPKTIYLIHQECQVPKMEGFLNLMFGYLGGGFSLTHALA